MGTNYYLHCKPPCPTCGRAAEPLHIGKSTVGWCFSLHVIPEAGIDDLPDWEVAWAQPGAHIITEYGQRVTPERMRAMITDRSWQRDHAVSREFYHVNRAEPGPNGLLRHELDGKHCVKHGAGTWDCITGEFS